MRKRLGTVLAVAGLIAAPAMAQAQAHTGMAGMGDMPKHEFGVDLNFFYTKIGSLAGVSCSGNGCSAITVATPIDVRVGFVSSGKLMFEPRLNLGYTTLGGGHLLTLSPGVNVLYKMTPGTGPHNMMGMYLTAGAKLALTSFNSGGTGASTSSGTQLSINAGVGTRSAYGSAAWRPEAFVRYNFEHNCGASTNCFSAPSSFDLGVRLGLSLWH